MFDFLKAKKKAKFVDKETSLIEAELDKASDLDTFLDENSNSMNHPSLGGFITKYLIDHNIEKNDFVNTAMYAGFVRQYVYEIADPKKNIKCSQDKLVAIALILGMTVDEANHMMQYAGINTLYVKNPRDAVLSYAIKNNLSISDTNDLLISRNFEPLELSKERKSK